YLDPTIENASDLIFVTAVGRLFANILILVGVLRLLNETEYRIGVQYLLAVVIAGIISLFTSVAFPHAISRHAAEPTVAVFIRFLHGLRLAMLPVTKLMRAVDSAVAAAATDTETPEPEKVEQEIENEILSAVE